MDPHQAPPFNIGVMQGCLSAPTWPSEFQNAKSTGFDFIEWIFDGDPSPPLATPEGIEKIRRQVHETGVRVGAISADFFRTHLLVGPDGQPSPSALERLEWLLERAKLLEIPHIVLPFVEESSISRLIQFEGLGFILQKFLPQVEATNVGLHLKTDLPPAQFAELLGNISHHLVRAVYDTGSSEPAQALGSYGDFVGSVHIHDFENGAHCQTSLQILKELEFKGPFTLMEARDIESAIRHRQFVENLLQ